MRKLFLLAALVASTTLGCGTSQVTSPEKTNPGKIVYNDGSTILIKVTVDSVEYIVLDGYYSGAIIKHSK